MASSPTLPKPRRDALPEGRTYPGSRCCADASLSAFDCPLQVCLSDLPCDRASLQASANQELVSRLHRAGKKAGEIAEAVGLSKRQVFRYLSGARETSRV